MYKLKNILLLALGGLLFSCGRADNTNFELPKEGRFPFHLLKGIYFQEAHRTFKSGYIFNEMGFQQEPSWDIEFVKDDTVKALYPETQKMYSFYLHYDHGQVYNFAEEWFRLVSANKDSVVFQRLEVKGKEILKGIESDVYMKFYAKNFIKDSLKTTIEELRKPNKKDSLYVKNLSDKVNAQLDTNAKHNFAARVPVVFTPLSAMVKVERAKPNYGGIERTSAYSYLYPEYNITIEKAYKDFYFSFSALVDAKGELHLAQYVAVEEFKEPRERVINGIINVYFKNLMKINPGTTLGFPHTSMVYINLKGVKNAQ